METRINIKETLENLVKKCQEIGGAGDGKCVLNKDNEATCQYMAKEQTSEYDPGTMKYNHYHKCLLKK